MVVRRGHDPPPRVRRAHARGPGGGQGLDRRPRLHRRLRRQGPRLLPLGLHAHAGRRAVRVRRRHGQGFTIDEPEEELGTHMCIPPHWEHRRGEIDQLEPIDTVEQVVVNPHLAAPPVTAGRALARARRVAVVVHGRGQEPAYMLEHLVAPLDAPDVAYVLPAAAGGSWYPGRFNEPRPPTSRRSATRSRPSRRRSTRSSPPACRRSGSCSPGSRRAAASSPTCSRGRRGPTPASAVLTGALIGPEDDVDAARAARRPARVHGDQPLRRVGAARARRGDGAGAGGGGRARRARRSRTTASTASATRRWPACGRCWASR